MPLSEWPLASVCGLVGTWVGACMCVTASEYVQLGIRSKLKTRDVRAGRQRRQAEGM